MSQKTSDEWKNLVEQQVTSGLSLIVEQQMALSPLTGSIFVFCNKDKDKSTKEKYQRRQEVAKSLLDKFNQWLIEADVPPKGALGKAIGYWLLVIVRINGVNSTDIGKMAILILIITELNER